MALMSRQTTEYALWTSLILGAGVAVLMYQHSRHTGLVVDFLSGAGTPGGTEAPSTAGLHGQSPASSVWSPLGPNSNVGPFPYRPANPGYPNASASFPGLNPNRGDLISDPIAPKYI